MKKFMTIALALIMAVSFGGCRKAESGVLSGAEAEAFAEAEEGVYNEFSDALDQMEKELEALEAPEGFSTEPEAEAGEKTSVWSLFKGCENVKAEDMILADLTMNGALIAHTESAEDIGEFYNAANAIVITGETDAAAASEPSVTFEFITASGNVLEFTLDANQNLIAGGKTYTINEEGKDAILSFVESCNVQNRGR